MDGQKGCNVHSSAFQFFIKLYPWSNAQDSVGHKTIDFVILQVWLFLLWIWHTPYHANVTFYGKTYTIKRFH